MDLDKWHMMAYFYHLVFGQLWVTPDVMILYVVLRSKMKAREVKILWGFRNNINAPAVLELWVSVVWVWYKRSD